MNYREARVRRRWLCVLAAVALVFNAAFAAPRALEVDATSSGPPVETGYFRFGTASGPRGILKVTSRYLTLDGRPWLPVMGEFHYSRYPHQYWREELAKMRSAGVDIVATYVIWSHQEQEPGQFDWTGDRDLRRFVALCAAEGLKVLVRIGPWDHAEVRFGGTPDWVVRSVPTRRNDPVYLSYVARLYDQIERQLQGLLWKDGGPVIGVQLGNEYNLTGPGQGRAYIATLKRLALAAGLDVPLYTVTGWDGALYPEHEVTPVFGGYPAIPWVNSLTRLPPSEVYLFRFNSRVSGDLGAQTKGREVGDADRDASHTPFLGAEFAGGAPIMYARRPRVAADDIAAMLPVQLGSGVNLYGYYMFQGGRNPESALTLQESTATGGINDLPIKNYDFQAPLGEYGRERPVLGKLRPFHYFLNVFGSLVAPMVVHEPAILPKGAGDLATPRFSVRSSGDSGFLFFDSYVRHYAMTRQRGVRFLIHLPGGDLYLPRRPLDVPAGSYFIWPFNLDLAGGRLLYATAQLMARLRVAGTPTYIFRATPGIPTELAFDRSTVSSVRALAGNVEETKVSKRVLVVSVRGGTPGSNAVIATEGHVEDAARGSSLLDISLVGGGNVRVLILREKAAEESWVLPAGKPQYLLLTTDQVFAEGGEVTLRATGTPYFKFALFPAASHGPKADIPLTPCRAARPFACFEAHATPRILKVKVTPLRAAGLVPPVRVGGPDHAALVPYPEVFGSSAAWTITLPKRPLDGLSDAYLTIRYQGDVARLFAGPQLLDDQFFYGPPWRIGLKRFAEEDKGPLTLTVLPLRRDAPVYIEGLKTLPFTSSQIASLQSVTIEPEYQLRIDLSNMQ